MNSVIPISPVSEAQEKSIMLLVWRSCAFQPGFMVTLLRYWITTDASHMVDCYVECWWLPSLFLKRSKNIAVPILLSLQSDIFFLFFFLLFFCHANPVFDQLSIFFCWGSDYSILLWVCLIERVIRVDNMSLMERIPTDIKAFHRISDNPFLSVWGRHLSMSEIL